MRRLLRLSRIRMRRGVLWLWRQEGTPGQRARGLAAGVFCGCYPFFGLQIFLSVGVASMVRGVHRCGYLFPENNPRFKDSGYSGL